jgi:iron-sulfur cluster assembly protein
VLVLTPAAIEVVSSLTSAPGSPDGAGLRISPDPASSDGNLQVEITAQPAAEDQVVGDSAAKVFLDSQVAPYLADKVLDANVDPQGGAQLVIGSQEAPPT